MKQRIFFVFFVGFLTGCPIQAPQYHSTTRNLSYSPETAPVCVLVPPDASHFGKRYPNSGNDIARSIRSALNGIEQPSLQVSQLDRNAHALCMQRGAKLFISSEVLHYEEHSKNLLGKPDQMQIKLSLYSLDNLDAKRTLIYEGKSNLPLSNTALGVGLEQAVWKLMGVSQSNNADSYGLEWQSDSVPTGYGTKSNQDPWPYKD